MTTQSQPVAIVTGAARGIGAAIARRLAADGNAVAVNYATSREAADKVVAAIEASGGRAVAIQADISKPGGASALFDAAEAALGPIDILVNNAGVMRLAPLAELSDADFELQVATNIAGSFRGMREGAKRIRDGGRIINFSSSVVVQRQPRYSVYGATKAAIEVMTHVLAKELGPRGITVNAVAPGPVETDMFVTGKTDDQIQATAKANPRGRIGHPDEIAAVVSFLAGPDSGWVSGQIIRANGGVA